MIVSKAYPNPANESFKISYHLNNNNQNAQLEIFDAIGNQVKTINISSNSGTITIPTADLQSGVYFYRLVSNGAVSKTQRMVKQ